jgi:hypothetical protein
VGTGVAVGTSVAVGADAESGTSVAVADVTGIAGGRGGSGEPQAPNAMINTARTTGYTQWWWVNEEIFRLAFFIVHFTPINHRAKLIGAKNSH